MNDIIAGKHDKYIDDWAAGARSFGGEIWVRWGHEMNGNWYPWSSGNNGSDAQIWSKAYRHIHDRFRRAGASNVRWGLVLQRRKRARRELERSGENLSRRQLRGRRGCGRLQLWHDDGALQMAEF